MKRAALVVISALAVCTTPASVRAQDDVSPPGDRAVPFEVHGCEAEQTRALRAALRLELSEVTRPDGADDADGADAEDSAPSPPAALAIRVRCRRRRIRVTTVGVAACAFADDVRSGEASSRAASLAAAEQVRSCYERLAVADRPAAPDPSSPPAQQHEGPRPLAMRGWASLSADVLIPLYERQPWLAGAGLTGGVGYGRARFSLTASYWGGSRGALSGRAVLHLGALRGLLGAQLVVGTHAGLSVHVGARVGMAWLRGNRATRPVQGRRYRELWWAPVMVLETAILGARFDVPLELEVGVSPDPTLGLDVDGSTAVRWGGAWVRLGVGVRFR